MKICIAIFLPIALVISSASYAQPKITLSPGTVLDLGDRYAGQKVETTVTIKNEGTDTLRIKDIKAACGCTATLLKDKKDVLRPSDSTHLSLILDTKNLTGKTVKSVDIFSNDTANPKINVKFVVFVIERLKIFPSRIYFYVTSKDSAYTGKVKLTNQSADKTLKIVSVRTKFENLTVRTGKNKLSPGEETYLEASFRPTDLIPSQGMIELMTDDPDQDKFEINVFSLVRGK